jgi:hypothetical protein
MLNFVKAGIITDKHGNSFPTKELELATDEAIGIINMYPMIFPHLYKQGFKLRKYFENFLLKRREILFRSII